MYGAIKLMPRVVPITHMLNQPKVNAQEASSFFADGRAMRMPVPGTVARGYLPLGVSSLEAAATLINPLPRTPEVLAKGRQVFTLRCATCHGPLANGVSTLGAAYGAKPANLQAPQFLAYPDGKIVWTIVNGKNAMPSQAADLDPEERWAVVHYVRALQRAQNAKDEDLP
jgi:mono/diheme cytochrome c family protein